ncbi:MAG: hypothetical protein AB1938_33100 [Myxococcota bacterium]
MTDEALLEADATVRAHLRGESASAVQAFEALLLLVRAATLSDEEAELGGFRRTAAADYSAALLARLCESYERTFSC